VGANDSVQIDERSTRGHVGVTAKAVISLVGVGFR
jgi:hypothetical protein